MNKDVVSRGYMKDQKRLYAEQVTHLDAQNVLVIGSDGRGNIGAHIVTALQGAGHSVTTTAPWPDWDIRVRKDREEALKNDLTALVISSGMTWLDWIEDQPIQKIHSVITTNLIGPIEAVSEFVQVTRDNGAQKKIVLIGSMAYARVLNGSAPYCASKAGLAHFVRCAAWELAPKGFDVFGVHPSNTEGTPMTEDTVKGLQRYRHLTRDEAEAYWGAVLPKAAWLQPQDIGELVTFLMRPEAQYLSGANLELAGGQR